MGTSAYTFGFITLKIWPSRPKKPYVPDGPLKALWRIGCQVGGAFVTNSRLIAPL